MKLIMTFPQDLPMFSWKEHTNEFLQELLRHKSLPSTTCHTCGCIPADALVDSMDPSSQSHSPAGPFPIRCEDCHRGFVECISCSTQRHVNLPLHNVQVSRDSS